MTSITTTRNSPGGPSTLATLRRLLPTRPLSLAEALRIAELQANRLLEVSGVIAAPVPTEIVSLLPRLTLEYDFDMPVSGSSVWDRKRRSWVITLNASEPDTRLRFSLLHEYKHIIDHGSAGLTDSGGSYFGLSPVEYVAEYFAGCVLMPKRLVKRMWGDGIQRVSDLAGLFEVSERAMAVRLSQLRLAGPTPRCVQPLVAGRRRPAVPRRRSSYERPPSVHWKLPTAQVTA